MAFINASETFFTILTIFLASYWIYSQTCSQQVSIDYGLFGKGYGRKLALIIPFTYDQIGDLKQSLERNFGEFNACSLVHPISQSKAYADFIDLIFLLNADFSSGTGAAAYRAVKTKVLKLGLLESMDSLTQHSNSCVHSVKFRSANLHANQDHYPLGPSAMFFRVFEILGASLGDEEASSRTTTSIKPSLEYSAFFWMEPDVFACREGWLDSLYQQAIAFDTEYWMKGSLLRTDSLDYNFNNENDDTDDNQPFKSNNILSSSDQDPQLETDIYRVQQNWLLDLDITASTSSDVGDGKPGNNWALGYHLNGNSLYRLDDVEFLEFIAISKQKFFQNPERYYSSFDLCIGKLLFEDVFAATDSQSNHLNWPIVNRVSHRFKPSLFLQNFYRSPVNSTRLCHPQMAGWHETFLVHGKYVYW